MKKEWEVVIHEPTVRRLLACRQRDRENILTFLAGLAIHPDRRGDFTERDTSDRILQVVRTGRWLITYWSDHAVKEIRVVRIEKL